MARPLRKEFENACYHVINRGAGKKVIYQSDKHKNMFLQILKDAHELFGIEIHAYCLMDNHYHLLVRTPSANLSRAMRHINGVYTQRYNKIMKTDGALFRGRYKAIVVSYDEYFLNVSRYIHLNPVDAKIVINPEQYFWSSYRFYLNQDKRYLWLYINETLLLMNASNSVQAYKKFVQMGNDANTIKFYSEMKTPSIMGNADFKSNLLNTLSEKSKRASLSDFNRTRQLPTINMIIQVLASHFNINSEGFLKSNRGQTNIVRSIAIYASRMWAEERLAVIAEAFKSKSISNVSNIVESVKLKIQSDKALRELIERLRGQVFI